LDDAARKYYDKSPKAEKSKDRVTIVMQVAAKSKTPSLKGRFAKHLAITNPKLNNEFWEEVQVPSFNHSSCYLIFNLMS
jgi:hypothetical protein